MDGWIEWVDFMELRELKKIFPFIIELKKNHFPKAYVSTF